MRNEPGGCGACADAPEGWATLEVRSEYQPIVSLATGEAVAFEALLRARRPTGESVAPLDLFAEAAECDATTWLDQQARRAAISGAGPWLADRRLFVNFLPSTVYDPSRCLATTRAAARDADIPMERLVFEVVETEAVRDVAHLAAVFDEYRDLGCGVAIDDAGAGHSTEQLVRALRPDVVKIDRQLVVGLMHDAGARRRFESMLAAARDVDAITLAEGVETSDQHVAMADYGIDLAQGWHFGRPAPPPC